VALVLQTLGSNQALDLRGLGVWLLALTLWLDFTADNELADLKFPNRTSLALKFLAHTLYHLALLKAQEGQAIRIYA
jgi:hypothetical protein